MAPLYKRYIPPKPSDNGPVPSQSTAQTGPKPVKAAPPPEDAPNKRKRERTEEEVAERKAKKLKKKGIDPATVPPPQPTAQKTAPPPTPPFAPVPPEVAHVETDGPVFEAKGTFAHVKDAKKRHKLEKQAREQRKQTEKAKQDGREDGTVAAQQDTSKQGKNGGREVQSMPAGAEKAQQNGAISVDDGTGPTSGDRVDGLKPQKREKRKKNRSENENVNGTSESIQVPASEASPIDENTSQPKKRRHKLEAVFQSNDDDDGNAPNENQEHLKKHGSILKKFQQSSKLSQDVPPSVPSAEQEDNSRSEPVLLDLAPLPQPEKAQTPEFVPDPNALPSWISKPTIVSSDERAPFSSLGLDVKDVDHLSKLGFTNALPVQKAVIPLLLPPGTSGARFLPGSEIVLPDIAVSAPTGSGKTVAYLMPILESLKQAAGSGTLKALIVVPTRELVMQVAAVAESLARGTNIKVGMATGSGVFKDEQARLIRHGRRYDPKAYHELMAQAHRQNYPPEQDTDEVEDSVEGLGQENSKQNQRIEDAVCGLLEHVPTYESAFDVVVATPGRLLEHLKSTLGFSLSHLGWLVLDEADKLLDLQYDGFLNTINNEITRPRHEEEQDSREQYLRSKNLWEEQRERRVRKVVLSATMTKDVSKLLELKLQRPQMVVVRGAEQAASGADPDATDVAKESEDGFELPPTLDEYCVPVGDGSEKPLFLAEVLRTRIMPAFDGETSGQYDRDEDISDASDGDDASSTSSSSSDSDSDADSKSSGEESDQSAGSAAGTTPPPPPADHEPEQSTLHPSRAALLPNHDHLKPLAPTVLIFTSSTESTTRLSHLLSNLHPTWAPWIATMTRSTPSRSILPHSDLAKPIITISTDRAARGLDALGSRAVTHVVQYDVPRSTTGYVHRVGRTARAGRPGEAWTLFSHSEGRWFMKEVVKTAKIKRRGEGVEKVKISAGGDNERERLAKVVAKMRDEVFSGGKPRTVKVANRA
ncbi:ATP-dependent RNA helicase dbp6 [Saxophila tyrrhenica]|uniref:ATP-dependent RNA helicase n=1 Tax=Saxophila tyrrhenica TaxID=1690608 RepID=A0AAV9NZ16_9PEZI|nr:ATP-dependent RNA helicase dbp6 [Saxophila tyrrhenica]